MRQKLTQYRAEIDAYLSNLGDWKGPNNEDQAELLRLEPTVKEILKRLDPALADFNINSRTGDTDARDFVNRGLDLLAERNEWAARLTPDAPVLAADQFHPWVWQAARTLWDSGHYRHAVQAAATAVNDHTQDKLSCRDVADTQLMQEAFSPNPSEPGRPRLRCPGDPTSQTTHSRQRGALQYAVGCFSAIRNPATHERGEWGQQEAIEALAALSVLARWIDGWTLDRTPRQGECLEG